MPIDESCNFSTSDEFVEFLQETLIPDLIATGYEATAQDFREAIVWINHYKAKADGNG